MAFLFSFQFEVEITDRPESLSFFCLGNRNYQAPEVRDKTIKRYATEPATVWSLGVVLYEMATGQQYRHRDPDFEKIDRDEWKGKYSA